MVAAKESGLTNVFLIKSPNLASISCSSDTVIHGRSACEVSQTRSRTTYPVFVFVHLDISLVLCLPFLPKKKKKQ